MSRPATARLPKPPSVEPKAYASWLHDLSSSERGRVAAFCRKHRMDFQVTCGGIGPLHVPYPPMPRASDSGHPTSLFASMDDWHGALSSAQLQYIDRECAGGEGRPSSDLCGDNTPLVVAFGGEPVTFTAGGRFAFARGTTAESDWPTATTPWIALDRNHDGTIDAGDELFGDHTPLADGTHAPNGFIALAELDANHDGRIDAADPAFASLVVGADRDNDRKSTPDELTPLSNTIVSISLANHVELRCDARSNCEGERATFVWRDAGGALHQGSVIDVYLPTR